MEACQSLLLKEKLASIYFAAGRRRRRHCHHIVTGLQAVLAQLAQLIKVQPTDSSTRGGKGGTNVFKVEGVVDLEEL